MLILYANRQFLLILYTNCQNTVYTFNSPFILRYIFLFSLVYLSKLLSYGQLYFNTMNSHAQLVYSNSVINISSQSQVGNYSVSWYRKLLEEGQNDCWMIAKSLSYMCSPLDVDFYIEAQIQQENKPSQIKLYGPIILQPKLIDAEPLMSFDIKTILNKNIPYNGFIDISDMPKIVLKIMNKQIAFDYNYFIENGWKKLSCSAEQPSTLTINIKPIKKEFLQFLKQLKIFIHIGETIRITFTNLQEKNLFLYQLVKYRGVSRSVKKQLTMNSKTKLQDNEQFYQKFNIPLLESEDGQQQCDQKILEDLYDVIYTPAPTKDPKLFHNPEQNKANNKNILQKKDTLRIKNTKKSQEKIHKIIRGTTNQTLRNFYSKINEQRLYSERDESTDHISFKQNANNELQQQFIKMNNFLMSENERLRKENQLLKRDKQQLQKVVAQKDNDKFRDFQTYLQLLNEKVSKMSDLINLHQNKSSKNQNNVDSISQNVNSNQISYKNPIQYHNTNVKKNLPVFLRKQDKKINDGIIRHKTDNNLHLHLCPDSIQAHQRTAKSPSTKSAKGQKVSAIRLNSNHEHRK